MRIAALQNAIVESTTASVQEQRDALHKRMGIMAETAAKAGAQIIAMQEAWS